MSGNTPSAATSTPAAGASSAPPARPKATARPRPPRPPRERPAPPPLPPVAPGVLAAGAGLRATLNLNRVGSSLEAAQPTHVTFQLPTVSFGGEATPAGGGEVEGGVVTVVHAYKAPSASFPSRSLRPGACTPPSYPPLSFPACLPACLPACRRRGNLPRALPLPLPKDPQRQRRRQGRAHRAAALRM